LLDHGHALLDATLEIHHLIADGFSIIRFTWVRTFSRRLFAFGSNIFEITHRTITASGHPAREAYIEARLTPPVLASQDPRARDRFSAD
jgi:hypothetical protein